MKIYKPLYDPRALPHSRPSTRGRSRLPAFDLLDIVRCPLCRVPLIARMTRRGPAFPCACNGQHLRH
jgi:hypothetical protein